MRSLVFLFAFLCGGLQFRSGLLPQSVTQSVSTINKSPSRFELKFQSELDNSTIIKHELQQQIFKCQVRLAPISQQQTNISQLKTRLKTVVTQLTKSQQQAQDSLISNTSSIKWQPSNVTLAIDWFRENQRIDTAFESSLAIIDVELKSSANFSTIAKNNIDKAAHKNSKPRIEIKNTLNGNQLKLTSRLKLNQVRENDSGRYKCIARASFQSSSSPPNQTEGNKNNQLYESNESPNKSTGFGSKLFLVEQTLESNGGTLLVKKSLAGQPEETVMPDGEQKKLKVAPSSREFSGKRRPDSVFSSTEQPTTLLDNSSSSILRLFLSHSQPTNDTRHATTQREEVNNNYEKYNTNKGGSMRGKGSQDSFSNSEKSSNNQAEFSADLPIGEANADKDNVSEGEFNYPYLSRNIETKSNKQQATLNNQFEDDEDLFKLDLDKIEFINNRQTSIEEDSQANDLNNLRSSRSGHKNPSRSLNQDISFPDEERPNSSEENFNGSNNLSSSSITMIKDKNQTTNSGTTTRISAYNSDSVLQDSYYGNNAERSQDNNKLFLVNNYLGNSFHLTKLQIAKLVNKITPELSCYTGSGEQYKGNVSITFDRRSCLNWSFVRRNIEKSDNSTGEISTTFKFDNHNYCRNPNSDSRGPWCFVQYIDELDNNENGSPSNLIVINIKQQQSTWSNFELAKDNYAQGKRFIQRFCPISACSEYLWIYIVAPPLGFLLFLSCLVAIFIRYVRKSYHNKSTLLFRPTLKRKGGGPLPKFNRLFQSQANRFSKPRKFRANLSSSCQRKGYLDDDVFEIVDDIDWSVGQTHSQLSPRSTESLKLNLSSFSSSSTDSKHLNSGCKSINPLFNEIALVDSTLIDTSTQLSNQNLIASNRSITQVGPMFATLRCQMRNQTNRNKSNKSSTYIEQCDLATTNNGSNNKLPPYVDRTNWLTNTNQPKQQSSCISGSPSSFSSSSSSSSNNIDPTSHPIKKRVLKADQANSHLISCSTTSEDIEKSSSSDQAVDSIYRSTDTNCFNEQYVKGSDLPQLNASSISISLDQQPIYEGKFSHVRLAYLKQHMNRASPSSSSSLSLLASSSFNSNNASVGHLGTQVAVCSLKSAAIIDPTIFMASNLKLRNLNHLNILKLIGYAQIIHDEIGNKNNTQSNTIHQQSLACSLIYDMTQLVDLIDWLKQQNKDSLTNNEPGDDLSIRRNLTCFSKQIALALDYLHDRNIIFKDLACRNCFLDPTKMLIKLASFNIEFISFNSNDEKTQNLKSMIRPKYLLDYYVIDSRPSDCQLLPLSWIPLESILFNKFNKQTDIWSFGCLIYELFSLGEVAYFGYSSKQVIDAVRSNLMPPKPLLCPNGIYKLMCKCLCDIPTIRPTIKQTYEQLNLYSGQCSSFLDHHLCSLATNMFDDNKNNCPFSPATSKRQLSDIKVQSKSATNRTNSISKTRSYANIKNSSHVTGIDQNLISKHDNNPITVSITPDDTVGKPEVTKIPLSRSINLGGTRSENTFSNFKNIATANQQSESNHYDEPIVNVKDLLSEK